MGVAKDGWDTLQSERLVDSFVARIRAAFRNGLVLYLLALLFFSVSLIAGRIVILTFRDYYDQLRKELASTLQGQHQAGRDDRHFGVVAALLREVNSGQKSRAALCPLEEVGCKRMEGFLWLFTQLAKDTQQNLTSSVPPESGREVATIPAGPWLPPDKKRLSQVRTDAKKVVNKSEERLRKMLPATVLTPALKEWKQQAVRDLQTYWTQEQSLPLEACQPQRSSARPLEPRHDDDFGPMLCERKDWDPPLTRLLVPSLENLGTKGKPISVKPRVQQAYWLSRLMDAALLPVVPSLCPADDKEAYAFVQAYFISPDNLIRLWQCKPDSKVSPNLFPSTRQWASASYFQELIQSASPRYDTAAYFDYGGLGLIRTRCERIVRPPPRDSEEEEILMGIVCADYTVPLASFSEALGKSQLLKVERFEATLAEGARFLPATVSHWPLAADRGASRQSKTEEEGRDKALIAALNKKLDEVQVGRERDTDVLIRALGQQVTRLSLEQVDEEPASFLIPLKVSEHRIQGLLTTPRVQYPDVWEPFLLMLFSLGTSLFLVVAGQTRARREGESETITNLLKNLEVGIVIVNEDEMIEAANDRSEDILGVLLPKLGRLRLGRGLSPQALADEEGVQLNFLDLIDSHIVRVDARGELWDRAEPYQDIITKQRRDNDSSTYYARLRLGLYAGHWVRISASPIILTRRIWSREGTTSQPRTFGIVSQVRPDNPALKTLEERWKKAIGGSGQGSDA
jgi:PAS domain-containing protein